LTVAADLDREATWRRAVQPILRLRFTLVLGMVVLAIQLSLSSPATHARAVRTFGTNWHTLVTGHLWRLVTGVLTEDQPGVRWSILIPFIWVGVAEWYLGWRRTSVVFFLSDWLSTIPVLIVLRVASAHSVWSAREIVRFDCGSSSAIFGTIAAFCASRRGPNWWIAPALLVQSMVTIWLTNRRLSDVQHLVAIGVGLGFGLAMRRSMPPEGASVAGVDG
jgi:hypothetical protein